MRLQYQVEPILVHPAGSEAAVCRYTGDKN